MYINLSSIIFIKVTSFLDGSVIYGSSREEAEELRLFTGGLLRYLSIYLSVCLSVIYGSSREEAEELRLFTGGLLRYNNASLYLPRRDS